MNIMTRNCCARKPELVLKFKNALKNEMHSVRKLERAESLDTLFSLLERRNLLSMVKINLLVLFDEYLEDVDYSKNLGKYRATLEENFAVIRRFYLEGKALNLQSKTSYSNETYFQIFAIGTVEHFLRKKLSRQSWTIQ